MFQHDGAYVEVVGTRIHIHNPGIAATCYVVDHLDGTLRVGPRRPVPISEVRQLYVGGLGRARALVALMSNGERLRLCRGTADALTRLARAFAEVGFPAVTKPTGWRKLLGLPPVRPDLRRG